MIKTFAAAGLAFGLALSPLAAFAQTDTGGAMPAKPMADTMAPKKPMMHHSMKHQSMTHHSMKHHMKPMAKDGEMQPKM